MAVCRCGKAKFKESDACPRCGAMLTIKARASRIVLLERPEKCLIGIRLMPSAKLLALPEEERTEILARQSEIAVSMFSVNHKDGTIYFSDDYWAQWFDIDDSSADGTWEYAGGECYNHNVNYQTKMEPA